MLDWSTTTGIACLIMYCGIVMSGLLSYEPHNWGANWCNATSHSLLWNDTLDCQNALQMGSYIAGLNDYSIRSSIAYTQCTLMAENSTIDSNTPLEDGFELTPLNCSTCNGIVMRWFLNSDNINSIYICDTIMDVVISNLSVVYCNDNARVLAAQYYNAVDNNTLDKWHVRLPVDYPTTCMESVSYYSGCHSEDVVSSPEPTDIMVWNGCGPSHALVTITYALSTAMFSTYHINLNTLIGVPRNRSSLIHSGYTYNVTSTANELFVGRAIDMEVKGGSTWDDVIQHVASTVIPTRLVEAITILFGIDKQYRGATYLNAWIGSVLHEIGKISYLTEPFYRTYCSYTTPTGDNASTISEVLCNASNT